MNKALIKGSELKQPEKLPEVYFAINTPVLLHLLTSFHALVYQNCNNCLHNNGKMTNEEKKMTKKAAKPMARDH
ncbi:hypothetical protein N7466_005970 [Penicillium verhagenii]|uniref:uncharacterized protein n=1 Tax=Penicillium verhagenii TaxID=1562060 RepID=UPI002545BA86|nr:uncharacterized protein N7466_005970 [Penicillium verhagenii]KAJ5930477.1 hypothetical protein N7466_005970 [Penicillium verhagenii]